MRYRRLKLQDLLREEISLMIHRDIKDPGLGFITILDVKMTEDLRYAKVFYSIYGNDEEKKKTTEALKRARGYMKALLGERLKLRYTPDITFIVDDTYEKIARIEEIINKGTNDRES
jgi:ribosome-binding factor A